MPAVTNTVERAIEIKQAQRLGADAARHRRKAHIKQLTASFDALLNNVELVRIMQFLRDTKNVIVLGQYRDENLKLWALQFSENGFQMADYLETILRKKGGGNLDPKSCYVTLSPLKCATIWGNSYETEDIALKIEKIIIARGEKLARQVIAKTNKSMRPKRSLLYYVLGLVVLAGLLLLARYAI